MFSNKRAFHSTEKGTPRVTIKDLKLLNFILKNSNYLNLCFAVSQYQSFEKAKH